MDYEDRRCRSCGRWACPHLQTKHKLVIECSKCQKVLIVDNDVAPADRRWTCSDCSKSNYASGWVI